MTITAGGPARNAAAEMAAGFLTGGVIGASLAAFIGGCVVGNGSLIVSGLALAAGYALLFFLVTLPRRTRDAAAPSTALAVIESMEVPASENSDVPVRFELSVVPDDAPGFRVEVRQDVNVVELTDYRPRGVVVVEHVPARPWTTRIVRRPTPVWEDRAAGAVVASVPGPVVKTEPETGCGGGLLTLLGLLLGAAAVLVLFRAELFEESGSADGSSDSSTVSTVSADGTVVFGPGRSMLDRDALRAAVESLTTGADRRRALTVVVRERELSVVFAPDGGDPAAFDVRSLPFDRVPALVEEARATLGVGSARDWQLIAEGVTGSLTLRVVVTGDAGTGVLEADGRGVVLRRVGG